MAFTGSYMSTTFKKELLEAVHDFTAVSGDTFYMALYTNSASLTAADATYSTGLTGQISTAGTNYTTGGKPLTNISPTVSINSGVCSFANVTWNIASFTARGALIYNSTKANRTVAVIDFGSDKTSTAGTFTIQFPTADSSNAIIRIA